MAVTISIYNHTLKLMMNKELVYTTLKVQLLDNTAAFDATHTTLAQVNNAGAYQVSGNGWDAGGELIANAAVTTVNTNGVMLDGDDIIVNAVGGSIGPAYKAVVYDDTHASDAPLFFIDFGQVEEAGETTDFKIVWGANGILRGSIL